MILFVVNITDHQARTYLYQSTMDSYQFALQCIVSQTILDCESFTEQAIKTVLVDELGQQNFLDALNDFKSFEGLNHKFIVNFTGAWLKYALKGVIDKDKIKDSIKASKLKRDILAGEFDKKELGGGSPPQLLSDELYAKINWSATDIDLDTSDDYSSQRKYMIMTCKKTYDDNSTRKVQMILMRPKDFIEVITSSKCVTEYRRYFIALAEIRRAYQETYTPWLISYKDSMIRQKDDNIDELKADIKTLLIDNQQLKADMNKVLVRSDHIIVQNDNQSIELKHLHIKTDNQSIELKQLHIKIDTMFEYLLSFARMTIPTWIGSSVIKKQYDTLMNGKTESYALQHLKVLFMVGFYNPLEEHTTETKVVDGETITFIGKAVMRAYTCCTNFADVRKRIKELYYKYTSGDTPMYMCKPLVITLISCEVNLERIISENANIFPEYSTVGWESKYKRYNITITKDSYADANTIFENICTKATTERFQGYQMRINEFNQSTDTKVDHRIVEYIDDVDAQFYASTKPFCQQYIDSYTVPRYNGKQLLEYMYERPSAKGTKRSEFNNRSLTTPQYTLRKVKDLLIDGAKVDHIKSMTDQGILSKTDLPALKALAKFENIDVSELEPPSDYESE